MSDNPCHVIELKCAPLSDGIAVGKVFAYGDILTRELPFYKISRKDIGYEIERITGSIKEVGKASISSADQFHTILGQPMAIFSTLKGPCWKIPLS